MACDHSLHSLDLITENIFCSIEPYLRRDTAFHQTWCFSSSSGYWCHNKKTLFLTSTQQRACQRSPLKSELCCSHSQSDDLIPLNAALFEVPRGSTKGVGCWRWCELVAKCSSSFLKSATKRGMPDLPPSCFFILIFVYVCVCAPNWVAVLAVFLCSWFNWLVLKLDVAFSLSLTLELASVQIRVPRGGMDSEDKSRCPSPKFGVVTMNLFKCVEQLTVIVTAAF